MLKQKFILFFLLVCSLSCFSQQVTIYISPGGHNANSGTVRQPVASLQQAQQLLRKYRSQFPTRPVTVILLPGTYFLDTTLILTSIDGGAQKAPVIFKASEEGKAIISGGIKINTKWNYWKNGIWKTQLTNVDSVQDLFINGRLEIPARYPNYDSTSKYFNGTSPDAISPGRIKKWKNPVGAFVHALHKYEWGSVHYRVTGVNSDGTLKMEGGFQNNRPFGMNDKIVYISNVFEELDAPNEWYYDREKQTLYFYPPPKCDLKNASVIISRLNNLIVIKGNEKDPVRNIEFKGLVFTNSAPTFMLTNEPLLRSDWRIYRGGAMLIEGAEDCIVQDCDFLDLGGNALFVSNYNRKVAIKGCYITGAGASAICFIGNSSAVRNPLFDYNQSVPFATLDRTAGPKSNDYPSNCEASNNLIHDIGRIEKQAAGVELSMCADILVSHNTIYNVPRSGINVSEGTWGGHTIEFNDVFNTVRETGDHGAFNSWGRDRYWRTDYNQMDSLTQSDPSLVFLDVLQPVTLRNNRFRCDNGWDIDLDDGSSNYRIYNNVCLNGGIKLREGFYRAVTNNILINNSFHPHVWFPVSHDKFMHNIVMDGYKPIQIKQWGDTIDYNLFPDTASLNQSQRRGTDSHSLIGDPMFINPLAGDYRVQQNSPAMKIGFQNFPMDRFGVVSLRLKKLAKQPPIPKQLFTKMIGDKDFITEWEGASIKKLVGLGERSATGMPEEKGVYIIYVKEGSPASKSGLQKNDVILKVDGQAVNNPKDVIATYHASQWKGVVPLLVYHNQQEKIIEVKKD